MSVSSTLILFWNVHVIYIFLGVFCVFYFCLFLFLEKGKWKRNWSPNKGNGAQGINGECIQFTVYNTPQQLKNLAKPKLKENSKMTFSVFLKTEIKRREEMKERQKSLQMEIMVRCHEWIQCHQLLKHNFTFFLITDLYFIKAHVLHFKSKRKTSIFFSIESRWWFTFYSSQVVS